MFALNCIKMTNITTNKQQIKYRLIATSMTNQRCQTSFLAITVFILGVHS